MIEVGINGAAGRMGRRLVALATEDRDLTVVAALEHAASPHLGHDAGAVAGVGTIGVRLTGRPDRKPAVLIDFSVPAATRGAIRLCRDEGIPLVIGTTGLTPEDDRAISDAARDIPVLQASNFSLVVNVLNDLAARAAKMLGPAYDIEVLEAHHRFKKDAPSGTALTLTRTLCEATGRDFDKDVRLERHGDEATRQPNEITVQTLRIGDHPGEHTIYFAALGERLEMKHVSTSRDSYVLGALQAAKWLSAGKAAGRYSMKDVLGL